MSVCNEGKEATGDYCPKDGTYMRIVKQESHVSYGGGYFLYFLECARGHKWTRVITQYNEAPPTLLERWENE